uniref:Kringle domain-containing protein n=1 Tax=Heterorhabditis bacteriophora TaxID=37862 RepID=A0A1I7XT42_HETBA
MNCVTIHLFRVCRGGNRSCADTERSPIGNHIKGSQTWPAAIMAQNYKQWYLLSEKSVRIVDASRWKSCNAYNDYFGSQPDSKIT